MIYIPIGIDCGIATFLKNKNLRNMALPFDWTMTYNGVSDIIKDNFINFIPKNNEIQCNNTRFIHNKFPDDIDKINRRIQRFLSLLHNNEEELIFIRKGHETRHHDEANKFDILIKNDLIDAEDLNNYLSYNYPELKYKIIVVLFCEKCFNKDILYTSNSNKIYIFNKLTNNLNLIEEEQIFINLFNNINSL